MARRTGREAVYAVADRFVQEALESDGSLFTPGATIWSAENIEDLYERFVGHLDESSDRFEDKFRRQLEGASLETRQLAAELLYIYLIFPDKFSGDSKRRIIQGVLYGTSIRVPSELDKVLDRGIASFGPALQNRYWQLAMLMEFFREWKTMPASDEALSDPWKFKDIVFSVPHEKAGVQREALLHLVYPDTFESIVSESQKRDIAKRLSYLADEDSGDIDRCILEIRKNLAPKYGEDFEFWHDEVKRLWSEDSEWNAFVRWARKFYEWNGFDENERDFKIVVADRLEKAKDTLLDGAEDWPARLKEAFKPPNNLLNFRQSQPFLEWSETSTETAEEALRALWDESSDILERLRAFSKLLPLEVLRGSGGRLAIASVLCLADDPLNNPIYRWEPLYKAQKLVDYPTAGSNLDEAELYEHSIEFIDRFVEEAAARGLDLRDRLDAQSLIWCVSKWGMDDEPVTSWTDTERAAFIRFRGEVETELWWRPLESPQGLEAELQRVLEKRIPAALREVLAAIFRRAVLLHQSVGTEGFLDPNSPSIMTGRLFACTVAKILYLLVDRDPDLIEPYDAGLSPQANNELMWLHCEIQDPDLYSLLQDEDAWAAYERMLMKFPDISRARSNHLNIDKMSVLTGERLGRDDKELAELVSLFREEHGSPLQGVEEERAAREEFAKDLSPEAVKNLDLKRFIHICQTNRAGSTGGVPQLSGYVTGADEESKEKLRRVVEHLLHADLPLERRLDDVLTGEYHVNSFGEAVATKLLYICYPDQILPVFVSKGPKGKTALMHHPALKLEPPETGSRGGSGSGSQRPVEGALGPILRRRHVRHEGVLVLAAERRSGRI